MNFWSNYDPSTGTGEEPWWNYAKSLDVGDIGKLPAYAYSKLPLPGQEMAGAVAGDWQQPEYRRGSYNNAQGRYDPNRYIPETTAEREWRGRPVPTAEEQDIRGHEQLGPVIDTAMAAMPAFRTAKTLGEAGYSAAGAGYKDLVYNGVTPDSGMLRRSAGSLLNRPIQAERRQLVGERIPGIDQSFEVTRRRPIANALDSLVGDGQGAATWGEQLAPAMMDEGGPIAIPGLLRGIRNKMERGLDNWRGSWNVDIPYVTQGEYPQTLFTKGVDNSALRAIAAAVGEKNPGRITPTVNGFAKTVTDDMGNYMADLIAMRKDRFTRGAGTHTHETVHIGNKRAQGYSGIKNAPQEYIDRAQTEVGNPRDVADYLEAVRLENMPYDVHLRKSPAYKDLGSLRMGDEMTARKLAGQTADYESEHRWYDPAPEMTDRLTTYVRSLIHPSLR